MLTREVTQQNVARVQVVGFTLVILLLVISGFIAIHNVRSIREATGTLVREQATTQRLIDQVLRTRQVLNSALYGIAASGSDWNRDEVLLGLATAEREMDLVGESAANGSERTLWKNMESAIRSFDAEARILTADPSKDPEPSKELLEKHEDVVSAATALITAAATRTGEAQRRIEAESSGLMTESAVLLAIGLLLSLASALLTLRVSGDLMRRMELQNQELARVSWQMLENQETTARRFSHELHDELGQTLTAVKANLSALRSISGVGEERVRDCIQLTDDAISNVREMSQLLRPTILDDFGLGAGLRWLADGFRQRTGIEVFCEAPFTGRLTDETETHLFRIAQEALTNIARHSHATRVAIDLQVRDEQASLRIEDNGQGIDNVESVGPGHLGLVGMRARARSAGGELVIQTGKNQGLAIEVTVPARTETHEQTEDPHIVG